MNTDKHGFLGIYTDGSVISRFVFSLQPVAARVVPSQRVLLRHRMRQLYSPHF